MSAYKKLNKQDAYITTYTAHKSWVASGSQFSDYNIEIVPELDNKYLCSLKQLYYPTKISGNIVSHSFDYYNQTTLYNQDTRNLGTDGTFIVSIPRDLTGANINPGTATSLTLKKVQSIKATVDGYITGKFTVDPTTVTGVDDFTILDDSEGGLYVSGSSPKRYVGDIIYPHGMLIITDANYALALKIAWTPIRGPKTTTSTADNIVLGWQSSHPIFTHNYHCKVRESECNYTYNPSALLNLTTTTYDNNKDVYNISASISNGYLNNKVTGSTFQPYITTVGLYNDANQLIAVGKMGQPIPKSANTETTIVVKIDI